MKRIHQLAALYAAVLLAATAAAQMLGRQWAVTVGVAVLGVVLASAALGFRRHRSLLAVLGAQNRRLAGTTRRIQRLESSMSAAAKAKKLEQVAETGTRQHRRLRKELAGLSSRLDRERVEHAREHSEVLSSLQDVQKQVRSLEAASRRPPPVPAGQRPFLTGREMFEDLALEGEHPSVVLTLDSFTPSHLFAGVRTALLTAVEIAQQMHRPLRLVVMRQPETSHADTVATLSDWIAHEAGAPELVADLRLSLPEAPHREEHHVDDIWVATYWSTAYCLAELVEAGTAHRDRVVYVVQDWEPGFFPWGTEHALARATYSHGFRLIVNSAPLADFIRDSTGAEIPPSHVFAPQVDQARLSEAASLWRPPAEGQPRLLFYARPAKPRNLFALGLESVRRWVRELPDGTRPLITLAGGDCGEVSFGPKADVVVRGKTDLDGYYELLSRTDLALALMHSPHPSHLPLELPMAGIPTVTNSMGRYRREWLPALHVCEPDPEAIARGLDKALAESTPGAHEPQPLPDELGLPLDEVVSTVVSELEGRPLS